MKNKAIIRDLSREEIYVEPFRSEAEADQSCGSGGCEHCGCNKKARLLKVINPQNFSLKRGNIVEIEYSTTRALRAFFGIILLPVLLFISVFILSKEILRFTEITALSAGLVSAVSAALISLFSGRQNSDQETPRIREVL